MQKYLPLFIITLGGIIVTVGDIVFKYRLTNKKPYLYRVGLGIYIIGTLFLIESFKYKNIAVASIIYILVNVICLVGASRFLFNEKITLLQFIGIFLGLCAIVILELK